MDLVISSRIGRERAVFRSRYRRARDYAGHIYRKARFSGLPRVLVDGLDLLGLTVRPFILYEERRAFGSAPEPAPSRDAYQVVELGERDLEEIAAFPVRFITLEGLRARLEAGKIGLAVKHEGRIVAFSWIDLEECNFRGYRFPLREDEAYLFDAYTSPAYRGRGLTPFLRERVYQDLESRGRRRYFSFSDALNRPANNFKRKLGAQKLELGLHIRLRGGLQRYRILRRYGASKPHLR